jgi:two-component system, cell cycle sensor histidine kinase and response regulator CckA
MSAVSPNSPERDQYSAGRAEANLSALIESTDDLIWSVDLEYRLLTFNRALRDNFENQFGVRVEIGMTPMAFIPADRASRWPPMYQRALSEGPFRTEYLLLDGRTLELAFHPIVADGEKTGVSVFGKDVTERKAAEEALREAERKYRDIFEGALEGIFQTTPHGDFRAANPACARILGYESAAELVSMVSDLARQLWADPRERTRFVATVEKYGSVRAYECQFKCKDGTVTWVAVNARKVPGVDGRTAYYEGFVEDISPRKRMEKALRKSEEKFAKTFLSSPAVTVLSDLDDGDRLVDLNEAFEEAVGFRREEVIGRTTVELGLWVSPDQHVEYEARLRADRRIRNLEALFRKKNGEILTGLISAELIEIDGRPFALAAVIDITERKLAEEALRRSEETFSKVFRSNPAVMNITDQSNGCIVDVNEAFERITGYSRDEVIGRTSADIGLWAEPAARGEALKQLQIDGRIRSLEHGFRKKNGDFGTGLLSMELVQIGGKPHVIGATIDITGRKMAEEERKRLEAELRQAQKLESVGRLAGGVAHDFNNLLTVINGYSGLLLKELSPGKQQWLYVEAMGRAGERAASLTRQLLAFSRKQILNPKTVDINTTIKDSERMLQPLIGEDIRFTTRLDPDLGQVVADPDQVCQVIVNLAVNARDAMPEGGTFEIRTMNVEVSEHEAGVHPDAKPGSYVVLRASDTGCGMDEATRQHVFEPFFTTKEQGKGTGLGLSTVYGIVRQSGGFIELFSEAGAGTSFHLYFPRIDGVAVDENLEGGGARALEGGETILVVEDQEAVRHTTSAILSEYGYHVLEAANGEDAMDIVRAYTGEIHLLLTDLVLPGVNGKEVSERLKAKRPNLKVLFTSGYTADVIAHRGVLDSGIAYIPKPFSSDALAGKVREVLNEPPASR